MGIVALFFEERIERAIIKGRLKKVVFWLSLAKWLKLQFGCLFLSQCIVRCCAFKPSEKKIEVVKLLLANGADANARVRTWLCATPLESAISAYDMAVVEVLAKNGADMYSALMFVVECEGVWRQKGNFAKSDQDALDLPPTVEVLESLLAYAPGISDAQLDELVVLALENSLPGVAPFLRSRANVC